MDAWLRGTALLPQPDTNSNEKRKALYGANHVPGAPITWLAGARLRWGWVPQSIRRAAAHLGIMFLTHCVTLGKTLNLSGP